MENKGPMCVKCTVSRCISREKGKKVPPSCPTEKYLDLARESIIENKRPENMEIHKGWHQMMHNLTSEGRDRFGWTRLDEIMEYARVRGMKKIGIALCYAMTLEARLLTDVLEGNGFEVVAVSCQCGELNAEDFGLEGLYFCNPIMQAEVLNRENTELNIVVGLCLGHDIIFFRYSKAETTVLVVKDRALGHNPTMALYLSNGYWRDRFFPQKEGEAPRKDLTWAGDKFKHMR